MYPEKTFRPDNLRQPFHTDREAPQAARCDNPKKYSSRQLSAFGQFSAKSLASVRKCTLKRRSGQTTSGCLSTPIARLPKWPAAMTRKRVAPDCLRLLVNPLRKATPAFGNVPRKNIPARQPSAFGQFPAKSLSSLRRFTPKKRSRQTAFDFGLIPSKRSLQPSEMCPSHSPRAVGFRL